MRKFILFFSIIISSCNNPSLLKKKYQFDEFENDITNIYKAGLLTEKELVLIHSTVVDYRDKFESNNIYSIKNKTYQEILNDGIKFKENKGIIPILTPSVKIPDSVNVEMIKNWVGFRNNESTLYIVHRLKINNLKNDGFIIDYIELDVRDPIGSLNTTFLFKPNYLIPSRKSVTIELITNYTTLKNEMLKYSKFDEFYLDDLKMVNYFEGELKEFKIKKAQDIDTIDANNMFYFFDIRQSLDYILR